MKMQCLVTATSRQYTVELAQHEALMLSRIMANIDPQNLAVQLAAELQDDLQASEEMTAHEVQTIMETMTTRAADQIYEYGVMMNMIRDLKGLSKL